VHWMMSTFGHTPHTKTQIVELAIASFIINTLLMQNYSSHFVVYISYLIIVKPISNSYVIMVIGILDWDGRLSPLHETKNVTCGCYVEY